MRRKANTALSMLLLLGPALAAAQNNRVEVFDQSGFFHSTSQLTYE